MFTTAGAACLTTGTNPMLISAWLSGTRISAASGVARQASRARKASRMIPPGRFAFPLICGEARRIASRASGVERGVQPGFGGDDPAAVAHLDRAVALAKTVRQGPVT